MSRPSDDATENACWLVKLHGGNDGLNTFVPFDDGVYYRDRPQLAIPGEQVRQLTPKFGFHPALTPLMSLWEGKELALVSGVGYPSPNCSKSFSFQVDRNFGDRLGQRGAGGSRMVAEGL